MSEELIGTCKLVANVLKELGHKVDITHFPGGCSVDFEDPKIREKVAKVIGRELGIPEGYAKERASWSSKGVIRVEEHGDKVKVEGEYPVAIFPDSFKICAVTHMPKQELFISEVHMHRDAGHGAVHIHFEGYIDRDDYVKSVSKFRRELTSFVRMSKICQEKMDLPKELEKVLFGEK